MSTYVDAHRILATIRHIRWAPRRELNPQASGTPDARTAGSWAALLALAFLLVAALAVERLRAQEDITSRPPATKTRLTTARRAFSGKVESVDLKKKILTVSTVEGSVTEIFPVKKDVPVTAPSGGKLKLKELKPGTNIIVYYLYRDGRRSVNEIMVLAVGSDKNKKKSAPPS